MRFINKHSVIGFIAGAIISPVVIVLGLYFFVTSQMSRLDVGSLQPPEIPTEQTVSLDWNIQTLDGNEINLENEFGDTILFLNLWATWCGPCVSEMPSIEKLYQRFKGRVAFACISNEEIETIRKFKDEKGYTFPIYHIAGKAPPGFQSGAIPATFILSREGQIELKHIGGADWSHETVVSFLETLVDRKPEHGIEEEG